MRFLAIDLGDKRTGLAFGNDTMNMANPLHTIDTASEHVRITEIGKAIDEYGPDALVIGLPLNMDGSEGPRVKMTRDFAEKLKTRFGLEIHYVDERLTSIAADEQLAGRDLTRKKKKSRSDPLAAAAILRDFLESRKA